MDNVNTEELLRKNIINLRESRNWSQAELARRLKMNNTILNKIETGNRKVSSFELDQIAEIFGVSTDYLLGRKKNDNDKNTDYTALEKALDNAKSFDGRPMSDNDREVIRGILKGYFTTKK